MDDYKDHQISIYRAMLGMTAKELCETIKRKVVRDCQRSEAYALGDVGLKTFWDEVCVFADEADGYEYESCLETLDEYIRNTMTKARLSDWQWMSIWLQTADGIDWLFHDDRATDQSLVWDERDVVQYIRDDYVVPAALDYSNARIRQYSESRYEMD